MENLYFLSKVSDILNKEIDVKDLSTKLKSLLDESVNGLNIYIFDNVTSTIRDCVDNWRILEEDLKK